MLPELCQTKETAMKRAGWGVLLLLLAGATLRSQDSSAPVANPVSSTVKSQLTRFSKTMVAAAESMPADKYGFKPTPEMNSFAHLVMHIAQSNFLLCSKISATAAPDSKLADSDGKDKLVAGVKASFDRSPVAQVHPACPERTRKEPRRARCLGLRLFPSPLYSSSAISVLSVSSVLILF